MTGVDDAKSARAALTTFLRSRREHVAQVAQTRVRRSPGLSREDVARRAEITTKWYTLVETGRAAGVSQRTLDAIADALALDDADRAALVALAAAVYPNLRRHADGDAAP